MTEKGREALIARGNRLLAGDYGRDDVRGDKHGGREQIPIVLRQPCVHGCGTTNGYYVMRNGQATVWCARCKLSQYYNAPKTETGLPQRSVRSRPNIKPSQGMQILREFGFRCALCGKRGTDGEGLHIGHILSVVDGQSMGLSNEQIYSDDVLFAECEECNLGDSRRSLSLKEAHIVNKARTVKRPLAGWLVAALTSISDVQNNMRGEK